MNTIIRKVHSEEHDLLREFLKRPYLGWDFSDPELAVAGTVFHPFEWLFVRLAPMVLAAAIAGIFMIRKPGRN